MSSDEWYSLRVGSIIGNKKGKNPRAVISIGLKRGITIPSKLARNGYGTTCYLHSDKGNFKLLKW